MRKLQRAIAFARCRVYAAYLVDGHAHNCASQAGGHGLPHAYLTQPTGEERDATKQREGITSNDKQRNRAASKEVRESESERETRTETEREIYEKARGMNKREGDVRDER